MTERGGKLGQIGRSEVTGCGGRANTNTNTNRITNPSNSTIDLLWRAYVHKVRLKIQMNRKQRVHCWRGDILKRTWGTQSDTNQR